MSPSRKRFVVSLAENEQSRTLINERKQIAFVLTPTELDPGYELHKTVHPVIWAVYDCSFGQPQTLDCDLTLGVATVRKEPDGSVVTPLTRVVPVGHYTALTRIHQRFEWCDVARLREDMPTTIIVNNDSGVEQAFAICLAMVEKFEYLPKFAPIVLFNRIPHSRYIKVKGSFNVQAYCGTNIKEMQQVHADKLEQINDERGNPWSVSLDDLSTVTSLHVSKSGSGQICISAQENEVSAANREMVDEVGQLKAKLKDFHYQVTRALGNDYLAVSRLKTDVLKIASQADSVSQNLDNTTGKVDNVGDKVEEMAVKVSECVKAIASLRAPESTKKDLAMRMEEVASTVQDLSKLHSSIKTMEEKMHGLGDSLQGLPKLQSNVGKLAEQVQELSEDMSSVNTNISSLNNRVSGVNKKVETNEESLASVERSVVGMRRTIVDTGDEVKQTSKSVKDIIAALQNKANTSDLIKIQTDAQNTTSRVTVLEEGAVGIRGKLGHMGGRIEGVDGGLKAVKETVEGLTEKAEIMTNNHLKMERSIGEVSRRARELEEGVQQLDVAYKNAEAASTKDRAYLRTLRDNLNEVSSTATEARSKATRLQDEIRNMTGEIGLVKRQCMAIEGSVQMVEGSVKAVDQNVQNVEREFRNMGVRSFMKGVWGRG